MKTSTVSLGEIAKVGAGQGAPQDKGAFSANGHLFIRASSLEILCNGGNESSLEKISASSAAIHHLRLYPKGTVIFAKSGMSATKNRVFRLRNPAYVVNHLATVVPCESLDGTYLRYWFEHLNPTSLIQDTAYPSISQERIEAVQIALHGLPEQQGIARILEQADRLRRTRRYALDLSDTFLPAAFLQLFGNPIRNSKSWHCTELEDIARVERGKFTPRPRNDPRYYGGKYPFIQTGDISKSGGRLDTWTQTLNEEGITVSRSFPALTVVIAIVGATIGMTSILDVEVYCPDSVVGIQVDPAKARHEYVEMLLRFWRPVFLAQAPETARANINLDTLRPLRIPLPPLHLQETYASVLEQQQQLHAVQREALRQAEHLFQSLLHRAFTTGL